MVLPRTPDGKYPERFKCYIGYSDPIAQKIYAGCDIFLMPSRFEGHPTGLLEALAYGLPCIATTGSNMREEIELADAGWTADNDAESIRSALLSMISDKSVILDFQFKNY